MMEAARSAEGITATGRNFRPAIKARKMGLSFGPDIPKRWLLNSPLASTMVNSLNLLFPLGERFFIRSVKYYADSIKETDPVLAEQVRGFYAQEARHALEHERFFEALEAQGYSIRRFLELYETIAYGFIEPNAPPSLRLSVTAALEHWTATFAERALEDDFLTAGAHPALRDLLLWHAAEEIEHKSVAFDLFEHVDGRYWMRMAGLLVGTALLFSFWLAGAAMFFAQDDAKAGVLAKHLRIGVKRRAFRIGRIARSAFDYMRPGFHPTDHDNFHLARSYFERIGREPAAAAS